MTHSDYKPRSNCSLSTNYPHRKQNKPTNSSLTSVSARYWTCWTPKMSCTKPAARWQMPSTTFSCRRCACWPPPAPCSTHSHCGQWAATHRKPRATPKQTMTWCNAAIKFRWRQRWTARLIPAQPNYRLIRANPWLLPLQPPLLSSPRHRRWSAPSYPRS